MDIEHRSSAANGKASKGGHSATFHNRSIFSHRIVGKAKFLHDMQDAVAGHEHLTCLDSF
ncbi:hypothetical protein [Paraburkholderia sp. XV]|uniref:hypothetical protein n=1 Tax=Paraburkholderia sp. XV TaxID=2831520 RepID=UPI001CD5E32F|nr:hypothetical protein [Paraburkholderia sp. XV]